MPKELFFTIESEKRTRIIDASLKEFSHHRYNEASINQIIQEADIARGSFYKYFEDKEDLYFFLLHQIVDTTAHAFLKDIIEAPTADIFTVLRALFMFNLRLISEEKYQAFFENLYLSMNYQLQQGLKSVFFEIRNELLEGQMANIQSASRFDKNHFLELLNIAELINRDLLMIKIANHFDDSCILSMYDTRIDVLRGRKSQDTIRS